MVTCFLRYVLDPYKLKEFEHYGKLWIPLVEKFGGKHHGYFLPSEGASNNVGLAMFTFPSLECSLKADPCVMRVSEPEPGKETLDEAQEAQRGTDHQEAA